MATIRIHKLRKHYHDSLAIRDLDLTIQDGEFVALVGPSGCGKSTLLRTIAGLESISSGEIFLNGQMINDVAPKDRDIAMVFQNYALYPHMTVAENLGFSLKIQGIEVKQRESRVRDVAETLGLSALLKRKPGQLSGGQRQRVAMGRAILRRPRVFLFDEPLSNLDARLRVEMRTEIKALHQRLGSTMVYVTHDQMEAMTMADRIAVLKDGRIEQVGTPLELYDRPRNAFVAGFIGSPSMNLIPGTVDLHQGGAVVTDDGIRLPFTAVNPPEQGTRVLYGIRPEHFVLEEAATLGLKVRVTEPTGAETLIAAQLGEHPVVALFHQRLAVTPGSTLAVSPELNHVQLFDAQSGERLNS